MQITVSKYELISVNENAKLLVELIPELAQYHTAMDWELQHAFTLHLPENNSTVEWDGYNLYVVIDLRTELVKQRRAIKIVAPLIRAFMALKPLWESTVEQLKEIYKK